MKYLNKKNKFKKMIIVALAAIMMIGVSPFSTVANEMNLSLENKSNIIEYLEDIDFGKEITFFSLEQNSMTRMPLHNSELLKFDTVEEFKEFLFLFMEEPFDFYENNEDEIQRVVSEYVGITPFRILHGTLNWWAPISSWNGFTATTWRNIDFSYTRTAPRSFRNDVTVTGSRLTGFQPGVHWSHLSGFTSRMFSDGSIDLTANGTWTMGVQITGNPVGITWNDSWTRNLPN